MAKMQLAKPEDLTRLMDRAAPEIRKLLGDEKMAQRFARCIMTEVRRIPALMNCEPNSFASAVMVAAQTNLEIGSALGESWLVPYKTECQFQIGYKGLLKLVYNSGYVKDVVAESVFEGDKFVYEVGDCPKLVHEPDIFAKERGEYKGTYAIAHTVLGGTVRAFVGALEMEGFKRRSKSFQKNSGPWVTDENEMRKKTALRRLCKLLPTSILPVAVYNALEQEDAREFKNAREAQIIVDNPLPELPDSPVGDPDQGETGDGTASPAGSTPPGTRKATLESVRNALTTILKQFDPDVQEEICNKAGLLETVAECDDIRILQSAYHEAEKRMEEQG